MRPRLYQQELFEEARKKNVVAFLDTGAGKTLISVLLIKDKADALSAGSRKKVSVFLAPKVDLVLQQASVLREHTGLEVGGYVGSMGVDFWKEKDWKLQLAKQQVMVMTHQILLNSLRHGFLLMEDINLLIFDECHHAKKKHPYNCIMREFYHNAPRKQDRPHIFGMTASPLDTKVGSDQAKITAFFEELEQNLDSRVLTVADRTLLEQVAPLPATELLHYPPPVMEPTLQAALDALRTIGVGLRLTGDEARFIQQKEALELQGLGKLKVVFDIEKIKTECHMFARHIGSVIYIAKDMGPVAALLCLSEVLKPIAKSIYKAKLFGQRQLEVRAAAANYVDDDLDIDNLQGDSWWDGKKMQYNTQRDHCSKMEVLALNTAMWKVVDQFRDLLAPSRGPVYSPTSGEEAKKLTWPAVCVRLREAIDCILAAADWTTFGRQLTSDPGQGGSGELRLVTAKVSALCRRLLQCKELATEHLAGAGSEGARAWSCIIFCQRKFTALALNWITSHCEQLRFLRSAAIMGSSGNAGSSPSVLRRQQAVLTDFKANKLNTLVATAVAEEGLDLTQCRLVVRYDPPATPLEFIQSRGRARARDSRMVLMVEEGNSKQLSLLEDVRGCEESMRAEAIRRQLDAGDDASDANSDDDEADDLADCLAPGAVATDREYRVPASGARVTLTSAKPLLYHYCSKLPTDKYTLLWPRFSTSSPELGQYQTTVILPNNAPVQQAVGKVHSKKSLAIGSACLVAIQALYEAGGLTDYLLPEAGLKTSSADAFADFDEAETDVSATAKDPDMPASAVLAPKRPDILSWPESGTCCNRRDQAEVTMKLYRLKLTTEMPPLEELTKSVAEKLPELEQPLGLLLPQALPELPPIPMQLLPGLVSLMELQHLGPRCISAEDHKAAMLWHEAICQQGEGKDIATMLKWKAKRTRQDAAADAANCTGADGLAAEPAAEEPAPKQQKLHHQQSGQATEAPGPAGDVTAVQAEPQTPEVEQSQQSDSKMPQAATETPLNREAPSSGAKLLENQEPSCSAPNGSVAIEAADSSRGEGLGPATRPDAEMRPRHACSEPASEAAASTPVDGTAAKTAAPPKKLLNLNTATQSENSAWFCVVPLLQPAASAEPLDVDWLAVRRMSGPQLEQLRWPSLYSEDLESKAQGCVIRTSHNSLYYDFLRIRRGINPNTLMPASAVDAPKDKGGNPQQLEARLDHSWESTRPESSSRRRWAKKHASGNRGAGPAGGETAAGEREGVPRSAGNSDGADKADAPAADEQLLTFAQYYRQRWKIQSLQPSDYMLECTSKAVQRRAESAKGENMSYGEATVLLPPGLCTTHPLKRRALLIARHIGSMLWWVNTLLLATEVRQKMASRDSPQLTLLLTAEALTPSYCQPHFNYERLETLGDAYLKYDCCLHVYCAYAKAHEGQLAERKQQVISNRNLSVVGHRTGLTQYIGLPANRMDWATGQKNKVKKVSHKVVADCVEALIGAHYIAGGVQAASDFMRHIGLLPPMPAVARQLPEPDRAAGSPVARKLEELLGYKFRNLTLLREACTHCSWPDQSAPCYQRLEFLGDAALDFLISRYYIIGYRDVEPGKMHDLRSASVNNTRLAILAAWHRLHPFLRYFSNRLFGEIAAFLASVKLAKKGDMTARSDSTARRTCMKQFSVRNYRKGGDASVASHLSPWAREQPEEAAFSAGTEAHPPAKQPRESSSHGDHSRDHHRHRNEKADYWSRREDRWSGGRREDHRSSGRKDEHQSGQHEGHERKRSRPGESEHRGKQQMLDKLVSAGFGLGFAAAPKVLGDLFEAIAGAVLVDCGNDLETLWKVLQPFLQPMVHPDRVPFHPVRTLLELAQKAGVQVAFRREECEEPGCFAMAAVVGGRIIGLCKSAATRDNARMLAAEAAAEAWTDKLVKELQAMPQQAPALEAKGPAGRQARKVDHPWAASGPAAAPVWGPSFPTPIGSPPGLAPAVASVAPSVSNLAATPATDGPAASQPPRSATLAAAETPFVNLNSAPREPAEALSVQQPQTAVAVAATALAATPVPGGFPMPAAAVGVATVQQPQTAVAVAVTPVPSGPPTPAVGGAAVQGAVQSNGHACKTECAAEGAAITGMAQTKVHSTVAVALPGGVGAMRIPKEWAAKMLKK